MVVAAHRSSFTWIRQSSFSFYQDKNKPLLGQQLFLRKTHKNI